MLRFESVEAQAGAFRLSAAFTLEAGARVALIGPSGAGKSTLLDLIAGFRAPVSGRVWLDGRDMTGVPPQARPVAILFQDNNLFPHLSVAQNLALALRPRGGRLSAEQNARLHGALDRVGLPGLATRLPGQLSGGQQSRAALARVLLQARPVLLLDEPFAALGPALKAEMLALVAEIAGQLGALTLLVTHDPQDARVFAPQTVLVAEGRAQAPQDTGPLLDTPPPALRAYLGG